MNSGVSLSKNSSVARARGHQNYVIIMVVIYFSYLNVQMTCTENYENWLNFVKVMPKILAVVSFLILTNLYFRISKVLQQRN